MTNLTRGSEQTFPKEDYSCQNCTISNQAGASYVFLDGNRGTITKSSAYCRKEANSDTRMKQRTDSTWKRVRSWILEDRQTLVLCLAGRVLETNDPTLSKLCSNRFLPCVEQ